MNLQFGAKMLLSSGHHLKIPSFSPLFLFLRKKYPPQLNITPSKNNTDYFWAYSSSG
jgi:hypothetical protein